MARSKRWWKKKPQTRRSLLVSLHDTDCPTCGQVYQGKYFYCGCHGTKNSFKARLRKVQKLVKKKDDNMRALILSQLDLT